MRAKIVILSVISLANLSCGSGEEQRFTREDTELITVTAGMLARNLAFTPEDSMWSPAPDPGSLARLEELAETDAGVWPLFFRAASDSAMKFEQLVINRQAEAQQAELL